MNIAMLSYWSCPKTRLGVLTAGGMNVYLTELTNNLVRLGHSVTIFTRSHREMEDHDVSLDPSVQLIHITEKSDDPYHGAILFADKIASYICEHEDQFDVLHSHYYFSGLSGLRVRNLLNIPLFHTFHTLAVMKEMYAGIHDERRIEAEKKIVKEADRILANTEFEKKELIEYYGGDENHITVIQPGVDHDIFIAYDKMTSRKKLRLPLHKRLILFVGRIDPVKGLSTLIEAISHLVQEHPDFEDTYRVLLIGGDIESRSFWQNAEVKKISNQIEDLQLGCCVKFIGSKPHRLLPYFYSASDVVVMPSVYESFGLVVLEAMASGACVLASRVGGLKYLIDDGVDGTLFESGNSLELANSLWMLLHDDILRERLRRAAITSSQELCWSRQAQKISELYKDKML